MAHLPVRETQEGKIDLAPAIAYCTNTARRSRWVANLLRGIISVGGVLVVTVLQLWAPLGGPSLLNQVTFYVVLGVAATVSVASALYSVLDFETRYKNYETSTRSVRRLRDRYEIELLRSPDDNDWKKHLELWGKSHIYEIERLIEDNNILDIDYHFTIADPLFLCPTLSPLLSCPLLSPINNIR